MLRPLFAALILLLLPACRSTAPASADTVTVEGTVTMRGNEPFAVPVLETDDRALYVLIFEERDASPLRTPRRYRITGELYRDLWQGRPFAHLRVATWEAAE